MGSRTEVCLLCLDVAWVNEGDKFDEETTEGDLTAPGFDDAFDGEEICTKPTWSSAVWTFGDGEERPIIDHEFDAFGKADVLEPTLIEDLDRLIRAKHARLMEMTESREFILGINQDVVVKRTTPVHGFQMVLLLHCHAWSSRGYEGDWDGDFEIDEPVETSLSELWDQHRSKK